MRIGRAKQVFTKIAQDRFSMTIEQYGPVWKGVEQAFTAACKSKNNATHVVQLGQERLRFQFQVADRRSYLSRSELRRRHVPVKMEFLSKDRI